MADNTVLNSGSGGDTIASDDIAGVKFQRVKLAIGADGSNDGDVAATNPLPITTNQSLDYDTGAGTATTQIVGIALPGAGGPVAGGTSTNPVVVDSELAAAAAASDSFANPTTAPVLSFLHTWNGTDWQRAKGNSNGQQVVGAWAHDTAAGTSSPLLIGGYGSAAAPTDVAADGRAVRAWYIRNGSAAVTVTAAGALIGGDATNGLDVDVTRVSGTVTIAGAVTLAAGATAIAKAEDVASADADVGVPAMAVRKATPANTSGTDGDYEFLQMSAGRLWVDPSGVTLTVGSHAVTNAGTFAVQADSVIPGTGATNLGKAEDAAHSSGDVGVMALGVRAATPTDRSAGATDGDYEPHGIAKNGGLWVSGSAEAQGGWSQATGSIGATKTDIGVANTPGQIGGWYIYNSNSSVSYVQFFNAQASAVTLGSTAPAYSLGIPATSAANIPPGLAGLQHATAISIAITTTRAGSTGPSSTVDYNLWYKQ